MMDDLVYAQKMAADFRAKPGGRFYEPLFTILESHGLKAHGAANSHTLLFKYTRANGEVLNVLAFRRQPIRVVSFPKGFWQDRKQKRVELCTPFDPISEQPSVGPSGGPSVKESAGQVIIREETCKRLETLCEAACQYVKSLDA
jgi:hypothetical protein